MSPHRDFKKSILLAINVSLQSDESHAPSPKEIKMSIGINLYMPWHITCVIYKKQNMNAHLCNAWPKNSNNLVQLCHLIYTFPPNQDYASSGDRPIHNVNGNWTHILYKHIHSSKSSSKTVGTCLTAHACPKLLLLLVLTFVQLVWITNWSYFMVRMQFLISTTQIDRNFQKKTNAKNLNIL